MSLGTIFKVEAATGILTTLVEFTGTSGTAKGSRPRAGLVNDGKGSFWGTTEFGGLADAGTIFRLSSSGTFENVIEFTGISGAFPGRNPGYGTLLLHNDGNIYGTTANGGVTPTGRAAGNGQVFRLRFGPTPKTLSGDVLSTTTAVLRGMLNPNGNATAASFQWGTDPQLATFSTVAAGTTEPGTAPVEVSATLTGLSESMAYYFRVIGISAENAVPQRGQIQSFTTTLTPFQEWKLTHLGDPNAPNDGDTDHDGLQTILEYVSGGDPLVASALPVGSIVAGNGSITFSRDTAATDVVLTVQGTDDLMEWTDLARGTGGAIMEALVPGVTVVESPAGPLRILEVRDIYSTNDLAHPQRFLRLLARP